MFYYLDGIVSMIDGNLAVIDCGGVGYACYTTCHTLSQIQLGRKQKLFTHCYIKEDTFDVYGFAQREELACFQQLIGVSGVGPKAALALLSSLSYSQFHLAVMTGDEKALTRAQGIGKKIAQRIILELKDKLSSEYNPNSGSNELPAAALSGNRISEAAAALMSLGYSNSEIGAALKGIDAERMTVEEMVRHGLKTMASK